MKTEKSNNAHFRLSNIIKLSDLVKNEISNGVQAWEVDHDTHEFAEINEEKDNLSITDDIMSMGKLRSKSSKNRCIYERTIPKILENPIY